MSAPEQTRMINDQLHRLVSPKISSLATFLRLTFHIGSGDDCAFMLSPEAPACNQTAMRHWVTRQLIDIATHRPDNTLMVELELRLWDQLSRFRMDESMLSLEVPTRMAINLKMPLPYWEPVPTAVACDPSKRLPREWAKQAAPEPAATHIRSGARRQTDSSRTPETDNVRSD
jgi:hypothetical protein